MSDELQNRIDDLEIRTAHQELALENLTAHSLEQDRSIERLQAEIEQLKRMLRELSPSPLAPESAETPPPHY